MRYSSEVCHGFLTLTQGPIDFLFSGHGTNLQKTLFSPNFTDLQPFPKEMYLSQLQKSCFLTECTAFESEIGKKLEEANNVM